MQDTEWEYTGKIEYSPSGLGGNWYGTITKAGHYMTSIRSYTRWLVWIWLKKEAILDRWYSRRSEKNRAKAGKEFKL